MKLKAAICAKLPMPKHVVGADGMHELTFYYREKKILVDKCSQQKIKKITVPVTEMLPLPLSNGTEHI